MAHLFGISLSAAEIPNTDTGPLYVFSETTFHFGNLMAGQWTNHTFYITNLGRSVLEVPHVRPSGPGMAFDGEWDRKVLPGKAGKIPIRFRMSGAPGTMPWKMGGEVLRAVAVTLDNKTNSPKLLLIKASLWGAIDTQPSSVQFRAIQGENGYETNSVRIVSQVETPLTLQSPICTNLLFGTELRTIQPGKEFELLVHWSNSLPASIGPSRTTPPLVQSYVTIKTSDTNMPLLSIPVSIAPEPLFTITPSFARLESFPGNRGFTSAGFTAFHRGKLPVQFLEASVNTETKSLSIHDGPDGKSSTVQAMFPPDLPSDKDLVFTIKTSHPSLPVFTVPIRKEK